MQELRDLVAKVLAERTVLGIKVRQPLACLTVKGSELNSQLLEILKEEVNVKKLDFNEKMEKEIELDTKLTDELKEEGIIREVIRQIQDMRKKKGLKPEDKITLFISGNEMLVKIVTNNAKAILFETKSQDLKEVSEIIDFDLEKEIAFDQDKIKIAIKK